MSAQSLRRRGLVLLLGAAAILVLVLVLVRPLDPLSAVWNPLLAGLAFTAAAASTGHHSPLRRPGPVVALWGLAQLAPNPLDLPVGPCTTAMLGIGGLVTASFATRGFAVSPASVAAPAVFLGIGQYLNSTWPGSLITFWTAGLALLWGIVELGNATRVSGARTSP
jgi:hypothetical protein